MRRWFFVFALVVFSQLRPGLAADGHGERLRAPEVTLPTATGTLSLHDLADKVVLVDFWASWCVPCRESFPWMSGIYKRYSERGLVIVAINLDGRRSAADTFLEKFPVPFAVAFDPARRSARAFHVTVLPSSFIVNRAGEIVYSHVGFAPEDERTIERQIEDALSR